MQSFKAGRLLGAAFLSKGILSMDISRYMIPVEQLIRRWNTKRDFERAYRTESEILAVNS